MTKERLRNQGGPSRCEKEQQPVGRHNYRIGLEGKSEMLIVAKKPGNAGGAKGHYCKHVSNEERSSA